MWYIGTPLIPDNILQYEQNTRCYISIYCLKNIHVIIYMKHIKLTKTNLGSSGILTFGQFRLSLWITTVLETHLRDWRHKSIKC